LSERPEDNTKGSPCFGGNSDLAANQRSESGSKVGSLVGAEGAGDIFPDGELAVVAGVDDAGGVVEEVGA
jgi:hypothetical protein